MKIECRFTLKTEILPIDYRRCIMSYIKKCLSIADEGKYFADYYGPAKDKPFCFSVVFKQLFFITSIYISHLL